MLASDKLEQKNFARLRGQIDPASRIDLAR